MSDGEEGALRTECLGEFDSEYPSAGGSVDQIEGESDNHAPVYVFSVRYEPELSRHPSR